MMDPLYVTYLEETEELLQKAEEYLIRMETDRSIDHINGLFRIFHSIKGSSQMIGYDDIGYLTHKIEDMLDMVRKGQIHLSGHILQLCFSGLDYVKKLFESKKIGNDDQEFTDEIEILGREIDKILTANSETETSTKNASPEDGIIGELKKKIRVGKNRYYICISFSDDIPMISPVLFMIFNNIKEIGTLLYTNVSDEDITGAASNADLSSFFIMLDSDLEEAELYTYLDVMYVEKVTIVDISEHRLMEQTMPFERGTRKFFENFFQEHLKLYPALFHRQNTFHPELVHAWCQKILEKADQLPVNAIWQNLKKEIETFYDRCLNATNGGQLALDDRSINSLREKYLDLFETAYGCARGKYYYKIFKVKNDHFMDSLSSFIERMDKSSTRKLLLDLSRLEIIRERELKSLIELKRQLNDMGIGMSVIIDNPLRKRLINIFDSIRTIENFELFHTEVDAALGVHIRRE